MLRASIDISLSGTFWGPEFWHWCKHTHYVTAVLLKIQRATKKNTLWNQFTVVVIVVSIVGRMTTLLSHAVNFTFPKICSIISIFSGSGSGNVNGNQQHSNKTPDMPETMPYAHIKCRIQVGAWSSNTTLRQFGCTHCRKGNRFRSMNMSTTTMIHEHMEDDTMQLR